MCMPPFDVSVGGERVLSYDKSHELFLGGGIRIRAVPPPFMALGRKGGNSFPVDYMSTSTGINLLRKPDILVLQVLPILYSSLHL